ncbi:glycosyltransferase involved in cell wall biosynthesis [Anaerosolibacter carboniphilus]|uniref:4,4'-diaponeurosporenoate glycosyltransferase n=1 Tax=Anaerosolibacter carboniphilus TaxID=1417629 RepID=A0A841KQ15_9FIRM|nr:glycosyltransferase [Anaerosolibacter carboniphilus]MBB6215421.1 glycosyltransferase involved in cell wall biosynthesis [Anaerosolibacter carboniphilus]
MKRPAISLIIPAYNEEKRIYNTLLSVSKAARLFEVETNEKIEIIVVDNNSKDRTAEIAQIFGVRIVQEERHIISAVRNTGAKAAQGDILCFLDADSEVSENIFNLVYQAMQTGEYIGGGAKMKLDQDGLFYKGLSFGSLVMSYITGVSAVLIYTKRETFEKLGGFDEKYYAGEDLKFIFNLRKEGKRLGKQFKNIYNGYVVTSARKFNAMSLKDITLFARLLVNNRMMTNPEYCYTWYDLSKRGE